MVSICKRRAVQVFIERVDATRPAQLSDFGAALTTAEASELQHVLEAADVKDRMEKTLFLLKQELELSKLQQTIGREVEAQISKEQRRYGNCVSVCCKYCVGCIGTLNTSD